MKFLIMGDLSKGLVVRGISNSGTFTKEDLDAEDRLEEASVNAVQGSKANDLDKVIKGMNQGNFKKGYAVSTVEKVIAKGGRVMKNETATNKNHCLIFGLKIKDANNLFSNVQDWPG